MALPLDAGSLGINGAAFTAVVGTGPADLTAGFPAALYGDLGQQFAAAAGAAGVAAAASAGGSRGSKAPKKNQDDDSLYTTVMLRNIPNKYTQHMLIEQLHRSGFKGDIDYLYLPIDFANRCNCGYCFVNFRSVAGRVRFASCFDGVAVQSCLPGFNSYKVCQVTKAKWQGREENVRRLRSGPELMAQLSSHPEWLPLLLDEAGEQETFPVDALPQAPPLASRRSGRKGGGGAMGGGGNAAAGGLQGQSGFAGGLGDAGAMGGGRGGGRGAGRRGKGGGRGAGPPAPNLFGALAPFPGFAGGSPAATFGGVPGMPVMTDAGLQYLPYSFGNFAAAGAYMPPPPYVGGFTGPAWSFGQEDPGLGGLAGGYEGFGTTDWQDPGARGSPRRVEMTSTRARRGGGGGRASD